jgi:hypothetical protein
MPQTWMKFDLISIYFLLWRCIVFISLSVASKVSQHWMSYNATSKGQPLKKFTTIWCNPLLVTGSNDNLSMKIGYDFPSHVNDVITTSCIAIYGVKQKKNPRICIKILNHLFQSCSTTYNPHKEMYKTLCLHRVLKTKSYEQMDPQN